MGLLGNSLGGLFGGGQQQQSARQVEMERAMMSQRANQYNNYSAYGLSSSATSLCTNDLVFSPTPRTRTAVEWLDERVNEIRVAL